MIGGVLSINAGGANVLRYGNARDLIIGAEGQFGIITATVLQLHPRPAFHATTLIALEDLNVAPSLLNAFQDASGNAVTAYEFMSRSYLEGHQELAPGARRFFDRSHPAILLVELSTVRSQDMGDILERVLADAMERNDVVDAIIAQNDMQRQEMWALREAAAKLAFRKHPVIDTDIAVPVDRLAEYLERIPKLMAVIDPGFTDIAVAYFGDGNIHYTVWPSEDDPEIEAALRVAIDALAVEMDGNFSAEHGVGFCKLPSMARHKNSVALGVMRTIKAALDPQGILTFGKKTLPSL